MKKTTIATLVVAAFAANAATAASNFDEAKAKWEAANHALTELKNQHTNQYGNLQFKNGDDIRLFTRIAKDLSAERGQARLEMLGLATPEQLAKLPEAVKSPELLHPQATPSIHLTPEPLKAPTLAVQKAPMIKPQPLTQKEPQILKAPTKQPQATPVLAGKTPSMLAQPELNPQPMYDAVPEIAQKAPTLQKPAAKAPAMTFDHVSDKWKAINHSINQLVDTAADRNDPTFQTIIKDLSAQREQARLEMLGLATPKQLAKVPPVIKTPELNPQPTNATPELAGKTPSIQKAPTIKPQATPELAGKTPSIQKEPTLKLDPQATPELQLTPAIQTATKAPTIQPQATPELPGKTPSLLKQPKLDPQPTAAPSLAQKTPAIQTPAAKAPAMIFDHVSDKWKTLNHSINQLVASKADRNDPTFQTIIKDLSAQREQARLEMLGLATPEQLAKVPPVTKAPELNPQPTNATPELAGKTPSIQKAPTLKLDPQATPELQLTPEIQTAAKAPTIKPQATPELPGKTPSIQKAPTLKLDPQATPELQLIPTIQTAAKAPTIKPQATPELAGKVPSIQKTPVAGVQAPTATPELAGKVPSIQKAPTLQPQATPQLVAEPQLIKQPKLDPQPVYAAVPAPAQKTPTIQAPAVKAPTAHVPDRTPDEAYAHMNRFSMRPVSNPDTLKKTVQLSRNPLYAGTEIGQKASATANRLAAIKLEQESRYRERVAHADRFGDIAPQTQADQPQASSHVHGSTVALGGAGANTRKGAGALAGLPVATGSTAYDDAQDADLKHLAQVSNTAGINNLTKFAAQTKAVDDLRTDFQDGQDAQNKRIDAVGVEAKDNASDIAAHDTRITNVEQNKADKANVDAEFQAVRQTLGDKADQSNVDSQVAAVRQDLGKKADQSNVDSQVGAVRQALNSGLADKVGQAAFDASQTAQNTRITTAQTTADGAVGVATLARAEVQNVGLIAVESHRLAEVNEQAITKNTGEIDKNTKAIAGHETRIQANSDELVKHDTRITKNSDGIKANKAEITKHETRITENRRDIDLNRDGIKANRGNIQKNSDRLDNHENRIQDLEANKGYGNKFAQLKNDVEQNRKHASAGIAGVAAMANIPQVSQGATFSVGAGAGTYDGEQGLAVGASARIGSQVVTKFSVSATTQHDFVAGAGVSYEW